MSRNRSSKHHCIAYVDSNNSKRGQLNLPRLADHARQYSGQDRIYNHQRKNSALPKIKIDSMLHIEGENQHPFLKLRKGRISQRAFGQKNTVLKDLQNKLKNLFDQKIFCGDLHHSERGKSDSFEQNINRNLNIIRNAQAQKVFSIAKLGVRDTNLRQSQRERNFSIQQDAKLNGKSVRCNKENQENIPKDKVGSKKERQSFKVVRSAKNIQAYSENLIEKSKSSQKMQVQSKTKSDNPQQVLVSDQKNTDLFADIQEYLGNPSQIRQQRHKGTHLIQKCKEQLEKQLQQVQQKLTKRIKNEPSVVSEQNPWQKNVIYGNTPEWLKVHFIQNPQNLQQWNTNNFQSEISRINIFHKKNELALACYLRQKKDLIALQLKKDQIALLKKIQK